MKISIFFVNKYLYCQDKDVIFNYNDASEDRNIIEVLYDKDVEELMLEDALDEISLSGSLTLKCEGSRFQGILENYMQFDLIIGFTMADDQDTRIYLEPYIFNITKVTQISDPSDQNKKFIVSFLDILSYTAMNHSFASVRKLAKDALSTAKNYEMLFNTIYDYLVSFIQRFTLGSFTYDKINFLENSDIDTSELVKMTINKIPQNATVLDALKIISYDACTSVNIEKDRLEAIKQDFELFENDEAALVPLFFKEEYLFHSAMYEAVFDADKKSEISDKITKLKDNSKKSKILLRSIFKRNMSMPFYFAFDKNKVIFESLNPEEETEESKTTNTEITDTADIETSFNCINGQRISPIISMTTNFIDMTVNNSRWKNMIFLYESQSKGDGNFLLKFDWIFNFYNRVFLNQSAKNYITTNILPDFYINEKIGLLNGSIKKDVKKETNTASSNSTSNNNTSSNTSNNTNNTANTNNATNTNTASTNANNTANNNNTNSNNITPANVNNSNSENTNTTPNSNTDANNIKSSTNLTIAPIASPDDEPESEETTALYEKDYHEYNANAFLIRSEDSTKETQYYIGKMITSFIMLNTTYSFDIEGSLFRRPNEIIKLNRHINNLASNDPNPNAPSGMNSKSKYTMVYVTHVKHYFRGKHFINTITANKIYDSYV